MLGEGLLLLFFSLIGAGFAILFAMAITVSGYARNSAIAGNVIIALGVLLYAGTNPWNSNFEWANNFRGLAIALFFIGSGFLIGTPCGMLIRFLKSQQ